MPGFDLGFLGGGQLARMSIQAAQRMGLRCLSLDPSSESPASQIAASVVGRLDDAGAIGEVFAQCERVTLENEFIPAAAIREALRLTGRAADVLIPGVETLATIQDKLLQRQAMEAAGVPSPRAVAIDPGSPLSAFELGFPMVLKSRFGGYDGKGTRYARTEAEFETHRGLWEGGGWLAEEFVPFRRELAVMVATDGVVRCELPTMETVQANHVCDVTFPASRSAVGAGDTFGVPARAVEAVGGRGLFGVELFELPDGRVLVNELAPRPHNTGHYTLDWGALSQFDLHVRLTMGLAIPPSVSGSDVAMANLLGQAGARDYRVGLGALLAGCPEARFHWYGKAESKAGRKMGHLNMPLPVGESIEGVIDRLRTARDVFYRAWIGRE